MIAVNAVTPGSSTFQPQKSLRNGQIAGTSHREELGDAFEDAKGRASIRFLAILGNSRPSIRFTAWSAPNVTRRDARRGERRPQTSRTAP